jgi:16S rRNA (uracil1498-N3)-methyltransferase
VVEASKQCGRNRLMEIGSPVVFSDFVHQPTAARRWLAHPGATTPKHRDIASNSSERERTQAICIGIGPEGGFADQEVCMAVDHGWHLVDLGPRVLRTETAAVALAACTTLAQRGL